MAYYENNDPFGAYNHANETKNHIEQIILCFCTAISCVRQAKEAHQNKDHCLRYELIDKTLSIIRGLQACLDFDTNEQVATALNNYYEQIELLLVAAQCDDNKEEICDKIVDNLRTVKESWESINIRQLSLEDGSNDNLPKGANDYKPQDIYV